jgi:hypothetical protein
MTSMGKSRAGGKKRKRKKGRKRNRLIGRVVLAAGATLVGASLVALVVQLVANLPGSHRMEDYADTPREPYEDLLYLTYLDSLRLDDLAVPATSDTGNIARLVLNAAGVPQETIESWGFVHDDLNELYLGMHRRDRLRRPGEAGVLKLLRTKQISVGHMILGQLHPYTRDGVINFCAIVTRGNTFGPKHSTVLYRHQGKLVHGKIGDAPRFAYFGTIVPGHDLETVFKENLLIKRRLK